MTLYGLSMAESFHKTKSKICAVDFQSLPCPALSGLVPPPCPAVSRLSRRVPPPRRDGKGDVAESFNSSTTT